MSIVAGGDERPPVGPIPLGPPDRTMGSSEVEVKAPTARIRGDERLRVVSPVPPPPDIAAKASLERGDLYQGEGR